MINTENKRRSVLAVLPVPDGGISMSDRLHPLWLYSGIPIVVSKLSAAINLIQAVNRTVWDVRAPDLEDYPDHLESEMCPIALTFEGPGEWHTKEDLRRENRQFAIEVYVDPRGQGSYGRQMTRTQALIESFKNAWSGLVTCTDAYVLDDCSTSIYLAMDLSQPIQDSGALIDMDYEQDTFYYGFRIVIPFLILSC
jgi:hypothetical protein